MRLLARIRPQLVISYGCDDKASRTYIAALNDVIASMARARRAAGIPRILLLRRRIHAWRQNQLAFLPPQVHVGDAPQAVDVIPTGDGAVVPRALAAMGGLGADRGARRLLPGEARLRAEPPAVMVVHEVLPAPATFGSDVRLVGVLSALAGLGFQVCADWVLLLRGGRARPRGPALFSRTAGGVAAG